MRQTSLFWVVIANSILYSNTVLADSMDDCLLKMMKQSPPEATVAELRSACEFRAETVVSIEDEEPTPFDTRWSIESKTWDVPFVISPHKPNYVLPISFNQNFNTKPFEQRYGRGTPYDQNEVKFQLSLKTPITTEIFNEHDGLYVAYTNRSWWQAYNKDVSSPFRETNHEPEVFYSMAMDKDIWGFKVRNISVGLNHQSNGRSHELSRSWNRIYASVLLEKENFYIGLKPWWRIPEDKKDNPEDADGDDNPDITKYMGYGELRVFYKLYDHNLSMMVRNNLRSDNKGAIQLDWSFPLNDKLRGYVQYFNGYGESLIDYDASVSRFSAGIMLSDWL